ncbi:MAG TPA: SDR family NAD(P)-dependent oxidoreductase [Puia sp.]|nr:SDR family NAD(P)-dependent oxidoreductase [Puia sp.]
MKLQGNKILITGGATGIGLGLAKRFIEEKNSVIICGRREQVLKEVADSLPHVITMTSDLSIEEERYELYNRIRENHPDLDVLVNNAGIQQWMNITDSDFYARAKEEIITNVIAPVHLTSLFVNLKSFKTIINITSGLSFAPMAKVPVYCATKAFFHSFTLSAQYLLKPRNIEVIEIIPPALNTDLGGKGIHDFAPPVSGFIDSVFEQLKQQKFQIAYQSSETRLNASAQQLREAFNMMNPPQN